MEEEFQIEEMVYQDSDEVVFQARERSTQRLVALRRFFLEDDALEKLRAEDDAGQSLFSEGLAWLQSLAIPGLRQVLGGGFDELDGTPYIVAEWVEGQTLADCAEAGSLAAGEGVVFEALARQTLLALPEESRDAVSLEAKEVVLARGPDGSLSSSLTISPRRYFGLMGGMNFPKVDRQQALLDLKSRFPEVSAGGGAAMSTQAIAPAAPKLASAQKGSGAGLLWSSLAALIVLAGGASFLVLKDKGEPALADQASQKELPSPPRPELANGSAPEKVASAQEPLAPPKDVASEGQPVPEIAAAEPNVAEEQKTPRRTAKRETAAKKPASGFVVSEKKVEGEIDASELFGKGPPEPAPEPDKSANSEPQEDIAEPSAAEPPTGWAPSGFLEVDSVFHSENLGELLATLKGSNVLVEGVVTSIGRSGSDLHWYFFFTDRTGDSFRVVYRHAYDSQSKKFEDWEGFVGKTVRLKGEAVAFAGGQAIRLHNWLEIQQPKGPRTFQISEVAKARSFLPADTEVTIEGTLIGFDRSGSSGYLLLQEESSVRGRFEMTGSLGRSEEFRKSLVPMKGKKVRLRGVMQDDSAPSVETVIELEKPGCVELVPE